MPFVPIYLRALIATVVLFWAIMQPKLWVGGIIGLSELVIMAVVLGFTFYLLAFDIIRHCRKFTLAESLLVCTLALWTYLYPRIVIENFALLTDSGLFSLQYNIFYLFNVV